MPRPWVVTGMVLLPSLLLLTSAADKPRGTTAVLSELRSVPSPAAAGALAPSLAVSPEGIVWLSWLESRTSGGHALRAARLDSAGWRPPITIAQGDSFFVNGFDPPSLVAHGGGRLVVHYGWKGAEPGAHEVRLTQSLDGGATWSPPQVPHRDGTPTEHGFVSLVAVGEDTRAVWLDGRKAVRESEGRQVVAPEGEYETTLRTAVLGAAGTLGDEWELDARVCDCCPTAAAMTASGPLIAYRGRSAGEIRDILVTRLEGGRWSQPVALHADGWKIAGCPVNGPSLAAAGKRVAAAWFTQANEKARVQVVFSNDGGAHFGSPVRVDGGQPLGRVQVKLLPGGDALVAWLEGKGSDVRIDVRRVGAKGGPGAPLTVGHTTARAGRPRLEVAGTRAVLAWTEPGTPSQVRTAIAHIPAAASGTDAR
jgi:hypothetical protein